MTYVNSAVSNIKSADEIMDFRKELKIEALEKSLSTLRNYKDRGDANMGKVVAIKSSFNEVVCTK